MFVAVLGGIHNLFLLPLAQNSAAGSVCVPDGREQVWSQHVGGKRGCFWPVPLQMFLLSRLRVTPATAVSSRDGSSAFLMPQGPSAHTHLGGLSEDKGPQARPGLSPRQALGRRKLQGGHWNFLRLVRRLPKE